MMDATTIQPGQRYAWRCLCDTWDVARTTIALSAGRHKGDGDPPLHRHPIVEPECLHEIKVGWTVLNVATGERFEWEASDSDGVNIGPCFAPLLALVATPEEDA